MNETEDRQRKKECRRELYERLCEHRNHLMDKDQKSVQSYDKYLLTMAAGGVGVTIAFIRNVIGQDPILYKWLLVSTWILWGLSIGFTVLSFYLSHRHLRKQIDSIDRRLRGDKDDDERDRFSWFVDNLNIVDGGLFVLGLVCLLIFASLNVR